MPPHSFTFLARNRLIAGISIATIVIEAPLKSGALNTANHAFNYEKKVFAIPYSLDYFKGQGCNYLLQNGAEPLVDISQIYDFLYKSAFQFNLFSINKKSKKIRNIPDEYLAYYEFIKENAPVSEEQIFSFFYKKCVADISADLSIMELNDYIKYQDGFYKI